MKVDYHLHLEEGPYTSSWLSQKFDAIAELTDYKETVNSLEWSKKVLDDLNKHVENGAFSEAWLDLYLKQAKRMGLKEVGIVDHMYRFKEYRHYYEENICLENNEMGNMQKRWLDAVCIESVEDFINLIEVAKKKWRKQGIELKLGIEADYFPGEKAENKLQGFLKEYDYDYVIGSVHFYKGWGFDNPKLQHLYLNYNLEELYKNFFDIVEQSIDSRLFDIIAHLDNLKVFEYRPSEEKLIKHYDRIAKKLSETDTATEVNAGLYYRYPIKEMCPSNKFLKILQKHNVKITTTSDAHFPNHIGKFADMQLEKLKEIGFTNIVTFNKRKRSEHPIN